ncbi:MAG: LysR family transcriptional regulator, partial [Alphaproteobacteria bacterium]
MERCRSHSTGTMDIHQIRCFQRVAELRSFTAAAKHLNITQPALSRQVQSLEDDLGTQLLLRTTRGVQPTAAGQVMMEMGANLLDYVEGIRRAVTSAANDPAGEVVVGLPPSLSGSLAPCLIEECRTQLPLVRIRIIEGLSMFIEEWLALGRIDLAILTHRPGMTMTQTPLCEEDLVLVGRACQADGSLRSISFDDMANLTLVMTRGFKDVLNQQMPSGRHLRCDLEMDSISAIRNVLATSDRCTVLP